MSYAQQRLWFLEQLEPGNAAYNIVCAVEIEGALNVAALAFALRQIAQRHESLRTRFIAIDGVPLQIVEPDFSIHLPLVDLSALEVGMAAEAAVRLSGQEAARGFDLLRGPLLRLRLFRLARSRHVLLVVMHHIISDGWSTGILIREFSALYNCYCDGQPSPLPDLPIQYADYAVWQRQRLQGPFLERQLEYWRERLLDQESPLLLPTDQVRRPEAGYGGASQTLELDQGLYRDLKRLSRSEGVTLFMTLLAGFQVLLARYTGRERVTVGTAVANRNWPELELLIGFFANTVVLQTDLSGNPTFREILRRVREVALGAYAHQEVPFEKLVEYLRPERSPGHLPLFQAWFVLQNSSESEVYLSDLSVRALDIPRTTARFSVALSMAETSNGIKAYLEYSNSIMNASAADRFLRDCRHLLETATAQPSLRLTELSSELFESTAQAAQYLADTSARFRFDAD